MTGSEEILFAIAIIGSVICVLTFFFSRTKDSNEFAEWRGSVNAKLDSILGLGERIEKLEETVQEHDINISKLQDSSIRAHERLDNIVGERK